MILFISHTGESLPIAARMLREGTDCGVYVHSPVHSRRCYEGIFERVKIHQLRKAVDLADVIVIDNVKVNDRSSRDLALLGMFGCSRDAEHTFAEVGGVIRKKGKQVIGAGIRIPCDTYNEIRVEGWFDGSEWTIFLCSVEDDRLMNADNGPEVGCQQSTIWPIPQADPLTISLTEHTEALKDFGYQGPVSVKQGEMRIGFSYDSTYGLLSMIEGRISDFFLDGFRVNFRERYAATERISIPPYPYAGRDMLDGLARNVLITGKIEDYPHIWFQDIYHDGHGLACAGSDGVIGIAAQAGKNISAAWARVYAAIERLGVQGSVQIRTDGPRRALKKSA
jgi:hypothetical protein